MRETYNEKRFTEDEREFARLQLAQMPPHLVTATAAPDEAADRNPPHMQGH